MAQIRWSLAAEADLREIETHIARDSPTYAVRTVDRIVESVDQLERFPLSGRMVPEFERQELREIIYRSYRIVYLFENEVVSILRVVHGARDLVGLQDREPSTFDR